LNDWRATPTILVAFVAFMPTPSIIEAVILSPLEIFPLMVETSALYTPDVPTSIVEPGPLKLIFDEFLLMTTPTKLLTLLTDAGSTV